MRDVDVFTQLLVLERPWVVDKVIFDAKDQSIGLLLRHRKNARFRCPQCAAVLPLYDHTPPRKWRHLDHGSWRTWVVASIPRVACLWHGVQRVGLPWALPGSRFTRGFEKHGIDTLLEADVLGASRLLRLSWDETWGLMTRAVHRGLKAKRRRVIRHLGVDEKAIAKRHRYVTLVGDLDRGTIEFISFDRKKSSLDEFYQSLSPRQLAGIQAIAMDMWEPYIGSTLQHVPEAESKIVFDRFHVMKHMLEAVDSVRKAEHRILQADGDHALKGTRYFWLFSEENVPEPYAERFGHLKRSHLKTARAWAIKEYLRDLWNYPHEDAARRHFHDWYSWAIRSRLKPVVAVARMIEAHLENVLTFCKHRVTNATLEGLNSKIQAVKKTPMVTAIGST